MRKNAAVNKYAAQKDLPKDELIDLINSDEKQYTSDEVVEIVEALGNLNGGDNSGDQGDQNNTNTQLADTGNANKKYEEWKVKPIYEDVTDAMDKVIGRKFIRFDKDAQSANRITFISPDTAEILNSQSENTLLHLFEAE